MGTLTRKGGDWLGASETFELPASARIGRHDDAELSIGELSMSRYHARVAWQDGQWWIEDLGSANGTFVDGAALKPNTPTPLAEGAEITFGMSRWTLTLTSASPPD